MSAVLAPPRVIPEPVTTRVTADELLAMPDEARYELVDGELKERNLSTLSSYVAGRVYLSIANHCENKKIAWVFPEGTGFQCFDNDPQRVRKADTAIIRRTRLERELIRAKGYVRIAPDLVVEVVSPNDLSYEVEEKVQEWLGAGVQQVWVIHPDLKRLSVWQSRKPAILLYEGDIVADELLLPGFNLKVADLFAIE